MRAVLLRGLVVGVLAVAAGGAVAQPPSALDKLKADTAALAAERAGAESTSAERAKLQAELRRLIERLDKAPPASPMPPPAAPSTVVPKTGGPALTAAPVDQLREATNRFRDGQFQAALNAFRQLNVAELEPEDRAFVQYMTAASLRRLGRTAEALPIYRAVGDAGEEPFIASSAVSQVALLRTAEDLQAQLTKLRERPKTR